jgi:hypothetical protein
MIDQQTQCASQTVMNMLEAPVSQKIFCDYPHTFKQHTSLWKPQAQWV